MTKLQERKIPKFQTGAITGPYEDGIKPAYIDLLLKNQDPYAKKLGEIALSDYPSEYKKYMVQPVSTLTSHLYPKVNKPYLKDQIHTEENSKKIATEHRAKYASLTDEEYAQMLSGEFKNELPDEYQSQLGKGLDNTDKHMLMKAALAAGSLASNLSHLKKARDAANNIKAPRVDAPLIANRPIQQLPQEIVDLKTKQIAAIQPKKTSDATLNAISGGLIAKVKADAMEGLTAAQVDTLVKERARFDEVNAKNAVANVAAMNEQNKLAADIYNQKAANNNAYYAERRNAINQWIYEGIAYPMDTLAAKREGKELLAQEQEWNKLQSIINNKIAMLKAQGINNPTLVNDINNLTAELERKAGYNA
jgi:hypothetical protein